MKKIISGKYESMIPRKECHVILCCFPIADGIKVGRYAFATIGSTEGESLEVLEHNVV